MAHDRVVKSESESESLDSSFSEDKAGEREEESEPEEVISPKPVFSNKVDITEGVSSADALSSDEGVSDDEAPPPINPEDTSATPPAKSPASKEDEALPVIEPEDHTATIPPVKSPAATKRAADDIDDAGGRDTKRARKNIGEETNNKSSFQRVFKDDDEIVLLEGLVEYKAKTGADPGTNMTGFLDFINKSLRFNATKTQLYEKIRGLRKKYENNSKKSNIAFKTPHEQRVFKLSKKLWKTVEANDVEEVRRVLDFGDAKRKEVGHANAAAVSPLLAACLRDLSMSAEELVIKNGLEIVRGPKKLELQEKWKQYRAEEIKLHLKRLALLTEQGYLVLQAMD